MSYCIVVDSGSLIKNGQIKDVYVVPMTITKTDKNQTWTLRDGIDIDAKEMLLDMEKGVEYKTASPVMGECADLLDQLSKKYDDVYVLSLSKNLSGAFNQWILLANDYKNVYVYNTNGVCDMYGWIIDDIKALKTVNNETVKAVVDEHIQKSNILIILDDFKYLLKGGRVNRIKLLIAKHLRFTLLLDLDKEKGVNMAGKIIKLDKLSKIINEHYKQAIRYNGNNIDKLVIFTSGVETKKKNVDSIVNILKTTFKDINIKYSELPSVFAAHLGTNYVAIAIKTK